MFTHELRSADDLEQAAGQSWMPVVAERRPDFQGHLSLQALGGAVSLSEARMTPLRTFRTERMARRTGRDDLLLFCVHLAGAGHLNQRGRIAELGAGSGVLYEARGAWDLTVATNVHSLLLQFPRDVLPLRAVELNDGLARRMDPGSPAMRLLSGYVTQLFHLADGLTDEQRHDAGLAGIDMLTMALRGRTPTVPGDQSAGAVLLGVMRTHIREHLSDPRLTVSELARRHHVSVRHTHVLFGRIGVTPAAYIREQRLLAARTLLSDPRHPVRSVSDIGAAVGLGELRTFERAFQRQFGTTPARWRREQRASLAN
ncbi:helix-turn-helix domain-containing protein [Micromonospora sp. CPCC 205558]|uniref:helix-turn-helix domain-containing protein n=1 Tax=Micromonospora sp. CPCC 205558 TaxID=3122403 RepID=UPI002FF00468